MDIDDYYDYKDSRRAQFNGARKKLVEGRHLLFKREIEGIEYYCITPNGETYETGIRLNISQRKNNLLLTLLFIIPKRNEINRK